MGVLDDAIRQHIELKRQHGASEEDLRREEQEALGPARRESPAPVEEPEAPERQGVKGETSETAVLLPVEDADALPDPEEFHDAPAPAEPEPFADHDPFGDDEPFAELEPPGAAVAGDEPDVVADDEPDDEDVLEETPEFLQETPEHDRLWFEQKPPRDFDFDDK